MTKDNTNAILNVCICYSGKDEIEDALDKTKDKNSVAEFESNLHGGYNVKPEILIRTSGEIRLSNFLLY